MAKTPTAAPPVRTTLLVRERIEYGDEAFVEMVVWQLPISVPPSPHKFKYRLVYIVSGQRVLGYDNERGKGDHRHLGDQESHYRFLSVDKLLADFVADVNRLRS